ncbi:MAG: YdcF family protein [Candidatus Peribacteraceae bacterium]|nr:YdcF family protein [Candidatus Peribacteraceae bacterium]
MPFPRTLRRTWFRVAILSSGVIVASGAAVGAFVLSHFDGTAVLPAECGIVFGAAVHPLFDGERRVVGSVAGPGIARRVDTAVALYKEGKLQKLFMTGGRGEGMRNSEAEVMRDRALQAGVDPEDIVTEGESHSTVENLLLTRPLTGSCSTVVGVSDRYHLARIEFLAARQGWELSTVPAQRRATANFEVWSVFREIGALVMFTMEYLLT